MEKDLHPLDRELISILVENGRIPIGQISKRLGVTSPTVRSRMKDLIQSGVLRVAGLVNCMKTKGITIAIVGITLERHQELDEKVEQISNLDKVHWSAVVTGQYDIIVEVVFSDDTDDIYQFLTGDLPQLGGIRSSETFVVLKAKRKWVLLPRGSVSCAPNST